MIIDIFLWSWFIGSLVTGFYAWKGINNLLDKNETYEQWITELGKDLQEITVEADRIDAAGTFRGDDETGYFWKAFKKLIDRLKAFDAIVEPKFILDEKQGVIYGTETEE